MSPAMDHQNDLMYYNNPYQSPHNPNMMLSPSDSSTPSNSNDACYNAAQWNMQTGMKSPNDFSNKIPQMNISEAQSNTQHSPMYFTQPNNHWVDYGPNIQNPNDITMKSTDNTGAGTFCDLDSQELRLLKTVGDNLQNLDSTDLANNLHVFDQNQLSETLSNNLTLDNNNRTMDETVENMTDSGIQRTLNEICNLNKMYPEN